MSKTLKQEAEEWAQDHWDDASYHGIDGFNHKFTQELSRSAGAIGYVSGYQAAQPRWISVKDTPVPKIIMVLGYDVKENYFVGWLDRKGRWHVLGQLDYAYEVTHWMPLPPTPEELDNE